jgi:hypothetical protein
MDIYSKQAHGMQIYNIIKISKVIMQFMEAVVDNASSFTNCEYDNNCKVHERGQLPLEETTRSVWR